MDHVLPKNPKITYQRTKKVTIAAERADIIIRDFPFKIWLEGSRILIIRIVTGMSVGGTENAGAFAEPVFHNDIPLSEEALNREIPFSEGDTFSFSKGDITIYNRELVLELTEGSFQTTLLEMSSRDIPFEGFPHYRRSPRLIKRIPTEKITIENPPEKKELSKSSLLQILIPPLVMLCVTIAISILMKRGLFVVMSIISTIMSIIASVTKYVKDKKECREHDKKRRELYDSYLLLIRKQIYRAREQETDALHYNNPSIQEIEGMIKGYGSRIYERSASDADFLVFAAGETREPVSFEISMQYNEMELDKDDLKKEAKGIQDRALMIENKPVTVDLKQAHLGLVGEKEVIHEQLKLIVAQLTFFHSYHELEIITVFHEKYNEDFKWMNWYPHARLHAINVFGCINSERMRDQMLGSLQRILKERKLKTEESRKESRYLPHYLFIIDEPGLIHDHAIMEYLDKEGDSLGFSIIYTAQMQANLPENIGTILQLDNSEQGTLLLNNRVMVNKKLRLFRAGDTDFAWMARNLSVLIHEQGIMSQIPESITFFDMYHVEKPEQLDIETRWKKNESHKSLAVPLGVRGTDDYLYLNLHEKAHGPHGLVAGTTGSGKSEIVQSYILSLSVNFHPHEAGFLLIDYKGGGMADLFRNLPHLLGTITNLDGSESMRAMASIKSELSRRQKIFGQHHINHINDYNKLFKLGEVEEPIPHLFLISDEFAELKKEQPEFMSELVSAARIGRSLGIHLILATQKPSGVVDDQIWTNSRFKLALKVQNEADSKEIIKTGDAAFITQPGRAYLQVGNNEIYELFQSAFSGAAYRTQKEKQETDNRVYLLNDLGQGELLNGDLSEKPESGQLEMTQLTATIDYIKELYKKEGAVPVKKPWLPPLGNRLVSPYTLRAEEAVNKEEAEQPLDLKAVLGLIDVPEEQRQSEYSINLLKEGNIAYFAAAGYGKSVFLATAVLSLAIKNCVDCLNFYICDFGNSALIPLNQLPHTADYISIDDEERQRKLIRILTEEMADRKKLFAGASVQNFDVYNQTCGEPLKAVVVVVDNFDVVKECGQEFEDFLAKLSRDGAGLGIYMIITATRQSGVRYATLGNFKNKLAGYLVDQTEAASLVGKSTYKPQDMEGRVLVKHAASAVNLMQIYTMVPFKNEVEYNAGLKTLIMLVCRMYPNKRAERIPVLPERFVHTMLGSYSRSNVLGEKTDILLGLHKETVELRGFDRGAAPFIILGDAGKGKTNLLKVILSQIAGKERIFLFDSANRELYYEKDAKELLYVEDTEDIKDFAEEIQDISIYRKDALNKELKENSRLTPKEFYASCEPVTILIDDTDEFAEVYKENGQKLLECLKLAADTGCTIIATVHSTKQKGYDELTKYFKTATEGIVVGSPGTTSIFPTVPSRELPAFGDGLLYHNGTYERIMLPKYENTEL